MSQSFLWNGEWERTTWVRNSCPLELQAAVPVSSFFLRKEVCSAGWKRVQIPFPFGTSWIWTQRITSIQNKMYYMYYKMHY